jgi:hypothetical protein
LACKIYKIIRAKDFWNWKSRYVMLLTIKWMDFGLVLWWTSKTFRELVFILKCNNKIKLEMVWFISNEFYDLWTFIWWKISTSFQKSISSWKKTWFILKIYKYVLINDFYTNNFFLGRWGKNSINKMKWNKQPQIMKLLHLKFWPKQIAPTIWSKEEGWGINCN